jgi:flagellar protein FlaI
MAVPETKEKTAVPEVAPEVKKEEAKKTGFSLDLAPKLIQLPEIADRKQINVRYPLIAPYAFAHIYWDDEAKEVLYTVEEPLLSDSEKEIFGLVMLGLEEMINVSYIRAVNTELLIEYLEKNVQSILIELGIKVPKETYEKLMYYVYRDSVGFNEIDPMLHDYYIEDIECNGYGFPIYIVHRKFENLRTNVIFKESQRLIDFVEKLSQKAGKYVSYARPILDGTLPDGSRVNATYTEDITTRGPTFTIRKFTAEPWTPIHLVKFNTVSPDILAFLWMAIQYKFNIMVVGETASGKTTFLNAIANFIPPEARIVSIEDTRELNLAHINWLPAVTRTGFGIPNVLGKQIGEISLFDLLRETFRQNPDYVILGETRGKETYVLFQGMASGHPSLCTFHAGSVETLIRRLETPPINLSPTLVESLDVICVVTNIKEQQKSRRRVKQIMEIIEATSNLGKINSNALFEWEPASDRFIRRAKSVVFDKLTKRTGIPVAALEQELAVRTKLIAVLAAKDITDFKVVSAIINAYYKDRDSVLKKYLPG